MLGIVPVDGPVSIHSMLRNGQPASQALKAVIQSDSVVAFSQTFAFCAIATSYLGVILGLFDFLADGFNIKKTGHGKIILCSFIFIPPFIMAILFPKIFLSALSYAGSFGCVILFVILPALMLWSNRYRHKLKSAFTTFGGKPSLIFMVLLGLAVIVLQFLLTFKVIPTS